MAIEIKELHVRLHVGKDTAAGKDTQSSVSIGGELPDTDELVGKTVKEVLRILKELEER